MKRIIPFLLLFSALHCFAQQDTLVKYFDIQGKETDLQRSVYYFVAFPSNSFWQRYDVYSDIQKIQSKGYYTDTSFKTPVGPFISFYRNGSIKTKGSYHLGKKSGYWVGYFENGLVNDSSFYVEGTLEQQSSWDENGQLINLINRDANGTLIGKRFSSPGTLMDSGRFENGKKEGEWTYYSGTGKQLVNFHADSVVSFTCLDMSGNISKSCIYEQEAVPKDGMEGWQSYIRSAMMLYLPKAYFNGELSGTVMVRFIVDKDGLTRDAEVISSTEPQLNAAALNIIKNAPKWKPAIQHNRKVASYHTQPLIFLKAR